MVEQESPLSSDQCVFVFGKGSEGQLGLGDNERRVTPYLLSWDQAPFISQIATGVGHTMILLETGELYTCGTGPDGQLGVGPEELSSLQPVPVQLPLENGDAILRVACGAHHTLVLTDNGFVYAFGRNDCGQLGIGKAGKDPVFTPTLVKPVFEQGPGASPATQTVELLVTDISCGSNHSAIITSTGDVFCFGSNENGKLGTDRRLASARVQRASPGHVSALFDIGVHSVACGGTFTLILTDDGEVFSCGDGRSGQLGHGDKTSLSEATLVAGLSDVVQIAAGDSHALAVTASGAVYAWGFNVYGQLGHGHQKNIYTPRLVSALDHVRVVQVVCGSQSSYAWTEQGKLYSWGCGLDGRLGIGDLRAASRPSLVSALVPDQQVLYTAATYRHVWVVTTSVEDDVVTTHELPLSPPTRAVNVVVLANRNDITCGVPAITESIHSTVATALREYGEAVNVTVTVIDPAQGTEAQHDSVLDEGRLAQVVDMCSKDDAIPIILLGQEYGAFEREFALPDPRLSAALANLHDLLPWTSQFHDRSALELMTLSAIRGARKDGRAGPLVYLLPAVPPPRVPTPPPPVVAEEPEPAAEEANSKKAGRKGKGGKASKNAPVPEEPEAPGNGTEHGSETGGEETESVLGPVMQAAPIDPQVQALAQKKLSSLKARISISGARITNVPESWATEGAIAKRLLRDVQREIDQRFDAGYDNSDGSRTRHALRQCRLRSARRQAAYVSSTGGDRVHIPSELRSVLTTHTEGVDGVSLVVYGPAGSGKSTCLARWSLECATLDTNSVSLFHSCQLGDGADTQDGIMNSLLLQMAQAGYPVERDANGDMLVNRRTFSSALSGLASRRPTVLIVDGAENADPLMWIPPTLPVGLRIILSCRSEDTVAQWQEMFSNLQYVEMPALDDPEQIKILEDHLYDTVGRGGHPHTPALHSDVFLTDYATNPLYLACAGVALRKGGSEGGHLLSELHAARSPADTLAQVILPVWEERLPGLAQVLPALAVSTCGLSAVEICDLAAFSSSHWLVVSHELREWVITVDGKLVPTPAFNTAIHARYLGTPKAYDQALSALVQYFTSRPSTHPRHALEVIPALIKLRRWEELRDELQDIETTLTLYECDAFMLLEGWSALAQAYDAGEVYRQSLTTWLQTHSTVSLAEESRVIGVIANILLKLQRAEDAVKILRPLVSKCTLALSKRGGHEKVTAIPADPALFTHTRVQVQARHLLGRALSAANRGTVGEAHALVESAFSSAHSIACATHQQEDYMLEATVLHTFAQLVATDGDPASCAEAIKWYEREILIRRNFAERNGPAAATAMHCIAQAAVVAAQNGDVSQVQKGIDHCLQSLDIRMRLHGMGSAVVAETLVVEGHLHRVRDQVEDADLPWQNALAIYRSLRGYEQESNLVQMLLDNGDDGGAGGGRDGDERATPNGDIFY
eukprot:TRINITY_DN1520_c0_g1_i3.p1 TRINITY_DN1520_c0_g1~~TRINITY_DN1520_c0_g1_i3.p1  ORF type:complete len:1436 (-),score=300.40 TRINITY_DN1520_c0_g1_i3:113-4420(-)